MKAGNSPGAYCIVQGATFLGNSIITGTGTSGSLANPTIFALTTQPPQYKNTCGVQ
jgi:hypothetical protein